jgi:hypothetical protein
MLRSPRKMTTFEAKTPILVTSSDRSALSELLTAINAKSNELTKRPPEVSSALSFIGGVRIGARALIDPKWRPMVWLYHSPIPVGRKGGNLLV